MGPVLLLCVVVCDQVKGEGGARLGAEEGRTMRQRGELWEGGMYFEMD